MDEEFELERLELMYEEEGIKSREEEIRQAGTKWLTVMLGLFAAGPYLQAQYEHNIFLSITVLGLIILFISLMFLKIGPEQSSISAERKLLQDRKKGMIEKERAKQKAKGNGTGKGKPEETGKSL
ncbi:MAG: hypothetical protein M1503_09580 [Thaumarchaeota archaeon]|nr:hypothetical protein [Nitrososphaerota archaeon]MCL5318489.1 hypothetical protein [Nitrososphaerota archaeon]